jgi:hypothetical protein
MLDRELSEFDIFPNEWSIITELCRTLEVSLLINLFIFV